MSGSPLALLSDPPPATGRIVPHVVAWNLTRRCNLECAHCYIAAGPAQVTSDELTTDECLRITDQILAINPAPLFVLSGGEPLLRPDLETIARHATEAGATVVVGTNGTLLTDERIEALQAAGVQGVAVSVDSLRPAYHDRFRHGHGSLGATLDAVERLRRHGLDFVIQTTLTRGNRDEVADLVAWAADRGAVSFNAYFLVSTGRGDGMRDVSPTDYEDLLTRLVDLHQEYLGRLMIRAKCAPHYMRIVHQRAPESPLLHYETRCPCGVQYCRITPDGKVTPCPYLPAAAGDLRRQLFGDIWQSSPVFADLRNGLLGGKCGTCNYRKLCGGCRARAFASEQDYLAADPSCAYEPDPDASLIEPPRSVTYGAAVTPTLQWSADAEARMRRIPSFVRGVVIDRVERYARRHGRDTITVELLQEVRRSMPVDFSKRQPFFLRDDA